MNEKTPEGWREKGEPDPHGTRYECPREDLAMGYLTDDQLANGAFLNYDRPLDIHAIMTKQEGYASPIAWMTAVKDRIRWLSRKLTDAQARLAEKNARIAEQQGAAIELARLLNEACEEIRNLKAHIRTDNTETLANALKEIELLREANLRLDEEWQAMRHDLSVAQEQLEQLQSAPAERGVAPAALSRAFITSESVDGNYRVVIKSATLQETQQVHNWLARLNPAPATADSDVREVK